MAILGGGHFLMSEVPLYIAHLTWRASPVRECQTREFIDYQTSMTTY